ncbi:hypothetical protein LJB88_02740 [Erysipelotrichaceae bacterium OttesenSCG-928-M19]|nr:hypothetical protein [Erysipelotrichaceae bacterium OttesenSCG-928-M19]
MKSKIIKISLIACLVLTLGFGIKAASDTVVSMGKQSVNVDEAFEQAKIDNKAEGLFSIVNSEILNKDYSYEKNEKVKDAVDQQIKSIKESNTDILSQYNLKDDMDLAIKGGILLQVQEEQYTKDQYTKLHVNEKSLKKMYDNKEGELTSYYVIKIDELLFDSDITKYEEAINDIETKLSKATKDDVESVFKELVKSYPKGSDEEENGLKSAVDRSQVDETLLKTLDKYEYLEFSKKAIDVDGVNYYILKMDKGERASFKASKERLTDLQYENAISENTYLTEYLLVELRKDNKISFADEKDQKIYDAATKQIIDDYNAAKDGE